MKHQHPFLNCIKSINEISEEECEQISAAGYATATTYAIGEEGGSGGRFPITHPIKEDGGSGRPIKPVLPPGITTYALGEEGGSSFPWPYR